MGGALPGSGAEPRWKVEILARHVQETTNGNSKPMEAAGKLDTTIAEQKVREGPIYHLRPSLVTEASGDRAYWWGGGLLGAEGVRWHPHPLIFLAF